MSYENVPKNFDNTRVVTQIKPDYLKLAADAFPVPTVNEAGAVLEVTDTGDRYVWSSTAWFQVHKAGRILVETPQPQQVDIVGQSGADPLNVNLVTPSPVPVDIVQESGKVELPGATFLTLNNDGVTYEATDNYSTTAANFRYEPSSFTTLVNILAIKMAFSGSYSNDDYATISGGLTNGITISAQSKGVPFKLNLLDVVKTNWDWIISNTIIQGSSSGTGGNASTIFSAFIDFRSLQDGGMVIDSSLNDFINFNLNDNFTSLEHHNFIIYGGIK